MSERPALPLKLYYRIGEVANVVGVETHVLRYWESEFSTIRPQKSAKGHRVYSRRDVEKLIAVKQLLYSEGYTVQGAKRKLQELGRGAGALAAKATVIAATQVETLPSASKGAEQGALGPAVLGERRSPEADASANASASNQPTSDLSHAPPSANPRHAYVEAGAKPPSVVEISPRNKDGAFHYRSALEALRSNLLDELSTFRTPQH